MGGEIWGAIALIAAAILAWLGKLSHIVSNFSERFVPRDELNRRFDTIRPEFEREVTAQDKRNEKRFDRVEAKLDWIMAALGQKVDK